MFGERNCLSLTISPLANALEIPGKDLPVVVYLCDGAFREGDGHVNSLRDESPSKSGWGSSNKAFVIAWTDIPRLTQMSIKEGHPWVVFNIV